MYLNVVPRLGRNVRDLVETGASLIDFPVEPLVTPVVNGWLKFLKKPQQEKDRWTLFNRSNPDDPGCVRDGADDGYIARKGEKTVRGGQYDIK